MKRHNLITVIVAVCAFWMGSATGLLFNNNTAATAVLPIPIYYDAAAVPQTPGDDNLAALIPTTSNPVTQTPAAPVVTTPAPVVTPAPVPTTPAPITVAPQTTTVTPPPTTVAPPPTTAAPPPTTVAPPPTTVAPPPTTVAPPPVTTTPPPPPATTPALPPNPTGSLIKTHMTLPAYQGLCASCH
jgi:hypothetical protein